MRIKGCRNNADIREATLNLCDALWSSDDASNDHRCSSALHTSRHNLTNTPTGREHRVKDDHKGPGDIPDTVHIPMRFRRGFITGKPSEHQLSIRTQLLHSTRKRKTSAKHRNYNKAPQSELKRLAPHIDWDGYLDQAGLTGQSSLVIGQPSDNPYGFARPCEAVENVSDLFAAMFSAERTPQQGHARWCRWWPRQVHI